MNTYNVVISVSTTVCIDAESPDESSPAALRLAAFPALSSSSRKGMYTDSSAAPISLRLNSSRRGFSMNCCPRFVRPADM